MRRTWRSRRRRLVPCHVRVHLNAPSVDTAFEVRYAREPGRAQTQRGVDASNALVTIHDGLAITIQLADLSFETRERNKLRARQATNVPFPWFADVDDQGIG